MLTLELNFVTDNRRSVDECLEELRQRSAVPFKVKWRGSPTNPEYVDVVEQVVIEFESEVDARAFRQSGTLRRIFSRHNRA